MRGLEMTRDWMIASGGNGVTNALCQHRHIGPSDRRSPRGGAELVRIACQLSFILKDLGCCTII
jgi:hypothetical protein